MSNDTNFIPGLFFKDKHENAPDFVIVKGSVKVADMAAWLATQDGEWVNFDLKRSREGKPYAQIDTWKPDGQKGGSRQASNAAPASDFSDDDIGF